MQKSDTMIGRLIDGKYELEYTMSAGGVATIYSALRRQIGDKVVVKVLKLDEKLDPVELKRFRLEASAAASIKHPNIVSIYDFGLLEDIAYIVMEKLEGHDLAREIRSWGIIPLERALRIFKQVCSAATAAHKQGLVHRDFKPANIIFQKPDGEDDLIKVVDFGIVKPMKERLEKLTAVDAAIGTPEYMSPEQCLGQKLDERTDIYSLGIVLYEMLTGDVPYSNAVPSAIMVQHAIGTPPPMSLKNPYIPPEVEAVVMKALSKELEGRFKTVLEFSVEFELACRSASLSRKSLDQSSRSAESQLFLSGLVENFDNWTPLPNYQPSLLSSSLVDTTVAAEAAYPARNNTSRFSFERFVGRDDEMKKLMERFEQVKEGNSKAVFIIGDPGIGKTELVVQFQKNSSDIPRFFLVGKFYEYVTDRPYRPYFDAVSSFRSNLPSSSLEQSVKDPLLKEKVVKQLSDIESLLHISSRNNEAVEQSTKYQTFELLAGLFKTISSVAPLVLFLDDLQWADSLSLEFLAYLLRNCDKENILVLATVRSQDLHDEQKSIRTWFRRIHRYPTFDQIKLSALSNDESKSLIDSVFGNMKTSESTIKKLLSASGGNPFYLCEIIRHLIQDQKIFWNGESWQCSELEDIELPGSIVELVDLHLRRLSDDTLDVFTRAAVIGEKFSLTLLRMISEVSKDDLMDIVDIGLKESIIKESIATYSEDDYFIFSHSTLRRALYERLSSYRRRRLHNQIGERLESKNIDNLEELAGELAYHFHQGTNYKKALRHSVVAGEAALNVFAIEDAYRYYFIAGECLSRMEELNSDIPYELDWLCRMHLSYGQVLMYLGKNELALSQLEIGLQLSYAAEVSSLQKRLLRALGELSWSCSEYKEAINYCNQALQINGEVDQAEECQIFSVLGNIYFSQGLVDQALDYYSKSLEKARETGEKTSEARALRHMALILGWHGESQKALEYLEEALKLSNSVGDRENERQSMLLKGNIYYQRRQFAEATENYKRSLAVAKAIGRRRGECRISVNLGEICRQVGDLESAKKYFDEALTIAMEIQDREIEGHTLSNLGLVYQDLGDFSLALDFFERAISIFQETNYRSNVEVEAFTGIANILWRQGRADKAKDYFAKAVESAKSLSLSHLVISCLRSLATCELSLGNSTQASVYLEQVISEIENVTSSQISEQESAQYKQIKSEVESELADLGF
ncbi:MAG: tetratricopeptide repeat protein [Blastocatellia bacterium]|nr:tetratricopeptide repeat protein [Blastocatellia bacterium]